MGWGDRGGPTHQWFHAEPLHPYPEVKALVETKRGPFTLRRSSHTSGTETQHTTLILDKDGHEVAAGRSTERHAPKGTL